MKKLVVLLMALSLVLVACGQKQPTAPSEAETKAPKETVAEPTKEEIAKETPAETEAPTTSAAPSEVP